jgi:hypothetical protein
MSIVDKQTFIQEKAIERSIKWSRHGLSELAQETFTVAEVELALESAKVIEDYSYQHRYLPDCLILAWISQNQPVHCVVAINEPHDYILIVTVYQPSPKEWHNDWRTRK